VAGADEPEPAIFGGAEHEAMAPEEAEGCGDLAGIERRDVGPDEHHRTGGAGSERPAHSDPEIARALSDGLCPAPPITSAATGLVGRHDDPQTPASVIRETAQQQRYHRSLELHRRDIADIACEATFAAAEPRCPDKQNEGAPHQP
jgi:hypothetical protein